jgi:hypothetical protein
MNIKLFINRIGINFTEPSTWRGVVLVFTAIGLALTPEQQTAIITAGIALSGLIGTFVKDTNES